MTDVVHDGGDDERESIEGVEGGGESPEVTQREGGLRDVARVDDVVVADETDTLAELAAGAAGPAGEEDAGAHSDGGVDGGSGVEGVDGEENRSSAGRSRSSCVVRPACECAMRNLASVAVLLVGGVREGVPTKTRRRRGASSESWRWDRRRSPRA